MSTRRIAYEVLLSVIEQGAYSNLALKEAAKSVSSSETAFLYALVYNALEHRSYVEYILSHYCKRQKKVVRTVLLLSAAELLFLSTPPHAAINEAVELTRSLGKNSSCGLVNAILRRLDKERGSLPSLPEDPSKRLSVLYGCPEFIASEWIATYGINGTEAIVSKRSSKMQVRAQYPFTTADLLKSLPCSVVQGKNDPNCLYLDEALNLDSNELFQSGKIAVQNEASMMICRSLGNLENANVLDACAAPGGKSAYLSSLHSGNIHLTCWEIHSHRKELMDTAFKRLHVNASTQQLDASVPHSEFISCFDAVLLDVPCSGFGLFSDKPDLRYNKSLSDIVSLSETQSRILFSCCDYVKPGGKLVYSTCTISKRENENQIGHFLNSRPDYTLLEQKQFLPMVDGIDGFYYAVMKRS